MKFKRQAQSLRKLVLFSEVFLYVEQNLRYFKITLFVHLEKRTE